MNRGMLVKRPGVARTTTTSFVTSALWLVATLFVLVLGQPMGNWTNAGQTSSTNSATGTLSAAIPAKLPAFQPRNTSSTVFADARARLAEWQLSSGDHSPSALVPVAPHIEPFAFAERQDRATGSPLYLTAAHSFDARAPPPHAT